MIDQSKKEFTYSKLKHKTKLANQRRIGFALGCLTAGVTGKGGIWREKPPDAESAVGAAYPKVWAKARTCPVHAVLGAVLQDDFEFELFASVNHCIYR